MYELFFNWFYGFFKIFYYCSSLQPLRFHCVDWFKPRSLRTKYDGIVRVFALENYKSNKKSCTLPTVVVLSLCSELANPVVAKRGPIFYLRGGGGGGILGGGVKGGVQCILNDWYRTRLSYDLATCVYTCMSCFSTDFMDFLKYFITVLHSKLLCLPPL
jgi:hypothetical protein